MEVGVNMVLKKMVEVVQQMDGVVDNKSVFGSKTNTNYY